MNNLCKKRSSCALLAPVVFCVLCSFTLIFKCATAFNNDELEIFDLVEEVNENFYQYLGLTQNAESSEIRKAYRKMSLLLHPDRNEAPDAEVKFRLLAAIYDTLKDPQKREIYDRVLAEGLPSWKQPIFYYRRIRKMGLAEGIVYILIISSFCQYIINWAAYWERHFTASENSTICSLKKNRLKLSKSANKNNSASNEFVQNEIKIKTLMDELVGSKPTFYDTLPFQFFNFSKRCIISLYYLPMVIGSIVKNRRDKQTADSEKYRRQANLNELKLELKKKRKEKYKNENFEKDVANSLTERNFSNEQSKVNYDEAEKASIFERPANASQVWTDEDLALLARLIKRYPGGTPDRWQLIAETLERYPNEVASMAKSAKSSTYTINVHKSSQGLTGLENFEVSNDDDKSVTSEDEDSDNEDGIVYNLASSKADYESFCDQSALKNKTKTRQLSPVTPLNGSIWDQASQKALEKAMVTFPKGTSERWDRIASKVPNKSKSDCIDRYKFLADEILKRKRQFEEEKSTVSSELS